MLKACFFPFFFSLPFPSFFFTFFFPSAAGDSLSPACVLFTFLLERTLSCHLLAVQKCKQRLSNQTITGDERASERAKKNENKMRIKKSRLGARAGRGGLVEELPEDRPGLAKNVDVAD